MNLLGLSVLMPGVGHSACPDTDLPPDLAATLATAETTYTGLDLPGFRDAMDQVRAELPCVEAEVSPHLAAEVHRFEGLRGFVDRQTDRASLAFAAARSVEPHHRFPDALVPEGNPVQELYTALNPHDGETVRVAEPTSGRLLMDGAATNQRSTTFPTVFQLVADNGDVEQTHYLWPEDPMPAYAGRPLPLPAIGATAEGVTGNSGVVRVLRGGPDRRLLAGAGGAAVGALALYGAAFFVHKRYDDATTEIGDLNRIRSTNNALVMASGVTATAAVGLGATAFLVARF